MDTKPSDLRIGVSIIIVSYNSRADLARCLPTIFNQTLQEAFEVIVVDNHGQDGVAEFLAATYPQVLLIANPANTGYAGGNNLGLVHAKGEWIFFLNPDTELGPGCLARLMQTARKHPAGLLTPKLLNPDGTINACGNQMHYTGITTCRGLNQPSENYHSQQPVPLLSGAALLVPLAVLTQIGAFNESYFMYFEDTELSLRARLAGYTLWCDADAVITHYYKLGFSPAKFYYLERNRLVTFLTIFTKATLIRLLPALLLTEVLMWGFSVRGWTYVQTRFRTYRYLYQNWASIRERHCDVQRLRKITDAGLLTDSLLSLPFDQLVGGWLGSWLDKLIRPFYRLARPSIAQE